MKRTTVIWLCVAVCLVAAGGAVFCLVMGANRWNFNLLWDEKMETKTFDVSGDFQRISIRSDTEKIDFRFSEDGKCRVVCREREKEAHTVSAANGTLSIEREDTRRWYDRISVFSFGAPSITVYLPRTEYAALAVEESTGDIVIPREFRFGSVDIRVSTGDVDCRASSLELLRIRTSTGDIRLEDLSAGELELTVSTGHVDLQSVVCEGNVGIAVSTGRASLADVTCESLSSSGGTGDIALRHVAAAQTVSITRGTGDVRFEQCDAGELNIETGTGKVTGSLLSPKVFIVHSDTGRISVPETVSGGKCRITTDTGDIVMEIVEK